MTKIDTYASESSIHGIRYILSQNQKLSTRFVWTVAIILSVCGFSYYIYAALIKFMIDPEIVMKSNDRNARDFPAPAVTICSNLFAKDNLASLYFVFKNYRTLNGNLNLTKSTCEYLAANVHWCQPNFAASMKKICPNQDLNHINVLELIDKSALTTEEAFFACTKGRCDQEISRVFTDFGICFTRNSLSFSSLFNNKTIHDDFKVYKRMVLKNGTVEDSSQWSPEKGYWPINNTYPHRAEQKLTFTFQPLLSDEEKYNLCALKNFRVFLHKPNEIVTPFHELIYVNFDEYSEFRVVVKSHRTDVALKKFPPAVRKCFFEGERKLKFFKSYSKALCQWECKTNKTLATCGCVKFSMPRDAKTPICNLTSLNCVEEITADHCNCLAPCDDVKYTYRMDKTHYIQDFYFLLPGYVMSWAQINIESEVVEEIENFMSYKVENFISDLGSLLGLFMGCSLLSIVEILFFITNSFIEVIAKFQTKNSPQVWQTIQTFEVNSASSFDDIAAAQKALFKIVLENQKTIEKIHKLIDEIIKRRNKYKNTISMQNNASLLSFDALSI